MQILEAEVNLREETRVAEQARAALEAKDYEQRAGGLKTTQQALSKRVADLTVRIRELPDGENEFANEINLLGMVEQVMDEAADILGTPETGPTAIAAETEAIELLLKSKRINPNGGGGGGSSPGGGGSGTTVDTALALIGTGANDKELREDHGISQATGESGNSLPEEFRAGLDEYFNRLESGDNNSLRTMNTIRPRWINSASRYLPMMGRAARLWRSQCSRRRFAPARDMLRTRPHRPSGRKSASSLLRPLRSPRRPTTPW